MLTAGWVLRDRRVAPMSHELAMRRIRSDYLELTGLKLTVAHAARLWAIDVDRAEAILQELTARGFLVCEDGLYGRR